MYVIDFNEICNVSGIRSLAVETLVYGMSYALGRLIHFLLVTVYLTRVFAGDRAFFSIYSEVYFLIALVLSLLGLRMETGYFRYASDGKHGAGNIYPLASQLVWIACGIFLLVVHLLLKPIGAWLHYPELLGVISMAAWIAVLDVASALPFARLRYEKKPTRYAWIKMGGILLNVALVLLLLHQHQGTAAQKLALVVGANLVSSAVVLVLLIPELRSALKPANWGLSPQLMHYVVPLIVVSLAYVFMQYGSTSLLKYFLPGDVRANLDTSSSYNAAVRLAVVMNLFATAFGYAVEPYFFRSAKAGDARESYARIAYYFAVCGAFIYLGTTLFVEAFALLLDKHYRDELFLVQILLLANLFMGLFSTISSWYKLTDNNRLLAGVSLSGMVLMVVLNIVLIPRFGNASAAYANLAAYAFVCGVAYVQGRSRYPVPYRPLALLSWIGGSVLAANALPALYRALSLPGLAGYALSLLALGVYALLFWQLEWRNRKTNKR